MQNRATDRLPPLDLLASFEASARHLSFTKAAAEAPIPSNTEDATGFAGQDVLLVGYGLTARPSEGGP